MAKLLVLAAAVFGLADSQEEVSPETNMLDNDVSNLYTGEHRYQPDQKVDPMDTMSQGVSSWLTGRHIGGHIPFQCKAADNWEDDMCQCLENGNIKSWYIPNSMFYILHTCSPENGLVLRTGHMQDRHTMPMQAMMACDTLKVFSYCFRQHCPEAIPGNWTGLCNEVHYTVPGCDVDCNAAPAQAIQSFLVILLAFAAGLVTRAL